jgi:hypothetical protein
VALDRRRGLLHDAGTMKSSDAKQRILARRRQFLAAAMAGAGVAACTPSADSGDRPTSAAPVVVSVEKPNADAGAEEPDAAEPVVPEPEPMVCLSEAPEEPDEPPLRPCLSIAPINP